MAIRTGLFSTSGTRISFHLPETSHGRLCLWTGLRCLLAGRERRQILRSVLDWDSTKDASTGKFWITLEDFLSHSLDFCVSCTVIVQDSRRDTCWGEATGRADRTDRALNLQWRLEVRREGPLFISLARDKRGNWGGTAPHYVGAIAPEEAANVLGTDRYGSPWIPLFRETT